MSASKREVDRVIAVPAKDRFFVEQRRLYFGHCQLCMTQMPPTHYKEHMNSWQIKHSKECVAVKA